MEIKKCIITLGGKGTRMLPITKTITKDMLPIVDVPIVFMQVKEAYLSGIREIIFIVTKENINLVKNFFSKNNDLTTYLNNDKDKLSLLDELNEIIDNTLIHYVIQEERGTYGAIYSARKYLNNEYFGVIFVDDIIDSNIPLLKELIKIHQETNNMIVAVKNTTFDELPNFGIVKYKSNNLIDDLLYKNEVSNSNHDIIHGRFILHTKIFTIKNKLKPFKHNEFQLPSALLLFNNEIEAYNYQGEYFDTGSKLGYLKANIHFALKRNDIKNNLLDYIKKMK